MIYLVVVKFLVFVSEVVSIFSKILIWIIGGGQKDTFAPPTQLLGGACPGCPLSLRLCTVSYFCNVFQTTKLQHLCQSSVFVTRLNSVKALKVSILNS